MARRPPEINRLITEVTSYVTIPLHRQCYSVRFCQFSNYSTTSSSSFKKMRKLDKEVVVTGREFLGPESQENGEMKNVVSKSNRVTEKRYSARFK